MTMTEWELTETRKLKAFIVENVEIRRDLDRRLAPFNNRQTEIHSQIKRTHHVVHDSDMPLNEHGFPKYQPRPMWHDGVGVFTVDLTPTAKAARKPLWAELDRLAEHYGPIREQRRICDLEIRIAQRRLEQILDAIAKREKRAR